MESISSWLWGSSTPSTPSQPHTGAPGTGSEPQSPLHLRPLTAITKEDKDQLLKLFEKYSSDQQDKDTLICVDTPTLKIWRREMPGEAVHLIKFLGTLPYNIELIDYVLNNSAVRKQWDTVMENWDEHTVDDHLLVYLSVKLPFPLAWRDFVHLRVLHNEGSHQKIVLDVSANHEKFPEKSGYVRAKTIFSGLRLTRIDDNTTEYMTVSQVDVAGLVPTTVVNYVAQSQPLTWFQGLETACARFKPEWEALKKK